MIQQPNHPDEAGTAESDLASLALAAAQVGAHAISRVAREGELRIETKAHDADFVTAADHAAEEAILGLVRAARPRDAILAEESGVHEGDSGIRWVIDPLDGTMNFVHGRRDYAVSVGVERLGERTSVPATGQEAWPAASGGPNTPTRAGRSNGTAAGAHFGDEGRIVAGAIVRPFDGDWAVGGLDGAGSGAGSGTGNGGASTASALSRRGPMLVSGTGELANALIGVGLPGGLDNQLRVHGLLMELTRKARDFRRTGSSACELLEVALGQQDGYFGFGVKLWDVAAGIALVEAAGGVCEWVRTTSGLTALVAGTPGIVENLIKLAKAV